ncbi:MAG: class I tRNA ligase family protein, partial [Spirochaetota bacterium]|nr:class I tRNA ligase family protein [Spirochaetota bacterium]
HDFCDWYVELSKINLYGNSAEKKKTSSSILVYVLSESLKLLHPIMPFITEEIWQKLPHEGESIMISKFPSLQEDLLDADATSKMNLIKEIVYNIRNIRGEMNVSPDLKLNIVIQTVNSNINDLLSTYEPYILTLGKVKSISITDLFTKNNKSASAVGTGYELFIPLEGLIDSEKEKARITKEINKLESELARTKQKLDNKNFLDNANKEVIEKERIKLEQFQSSLIKLNENLSIIN